LIDLFSKKVAGSWGSAPSRARRREFFLAVFLVLFLRLLAQKKNGENFINVTHSNLFPTFFFDTAGAKKKAEQRRNAEKVSLVATSDKGAALDLRPFLKKGRSKTFIL